LGLDLGQSIDPSALAILEKRGEGDESIFLCRHLERFPLGTSYPNIVRTMLERCQTPPLCYTSVGLALDGTGVGRPVVDLFLRARIRAEMTAILIHGGGFDEGSKSTNVRPLFDPLANAGFEWRI
jgi:hypothetical protein